MLLSTPLVRSLSGLTILIRRLAFFAITVTTVSQDQKSIRPNVGVISYSKRFLKSSTLACKMKYRHSFCSRKRGIEKT